MFSSTNFGARFPWRGFPLIQLVMVCLPALGLWGCGGSGGPPISGVSGTVMYQGKPVTQGVVNFISDAGFGTSAPLQPDGTYSLHSEHGAGIPHGTYRVTVTPPSATGSDTATEEKPLAPEPEFPQIPKKYRSFATSGLEITVGEGKQTFDINMES